MTGLFDVFSNKNATNAANNQIAGINMGIGDLTKSFGQGRTDLSSNYGEALKPFLWNNDVAKQGTTAYGNAMGLNGPEGNKAAVAAFWNNPAIQSQIDLGSENVLRNQARTGQLSSGKTNIDLQDYAQKVASQGWQNYVQNLQPYLNYGTTNAAGVADTYKGLGTGLNSSYMNEGNAKYGADTSMGNALANADLANNQASANQWGAIMGGAKALASFIPSDERLKEDIAPVGELADGQTVYRYRYKGDGRTHLGLIAQEVEQRTPDAVAEFDELGGYKAVDYNRATDFAATLMKMAA